MSVKEKIAYMKEKLITGFLYAVLIIFITGLIWSCQQGIKDRAACQECIYENANKVYPADVYCCYTNESCLKIGCDWGN